jgi:putative membrane protein
MKQFTPRVCAFLLPLALPAAALAADAEPASHLHSNSVPQALGLMVLFALVGIATAILGYRLFDKFTPGDLHKEIVEHKNVAAAIVAGTVILGVSIIVAAAIIG